MRLRMLVSGVAVVVFGCVIFFLTSHNDIGVNAKKASPSASRESKREPALLHDESVATKLTPTNVATANAIEASPASAVSTADYVAVDPLSDNGLPPYPLPETVASALETFAAENDVFILGETHGTQEVPALATMLLAPLTKLGYGVLALEIPKNELEPLNAWAIGETETVPEFFAKQWGDGIGNIQLLSLIRLARSQEYDWKLICFDKTVSESLAEFEELNRKSAANTKKPAATGFGLTEDAIALWQKRDAAMAANVASQLQGFVPRPKVLAICGNLHNRIENRAEDPTVFEWVKPLWPSFAAVLQRDNPELKVGTINIKFHSGGFFNGGKVNEIHGRKLDQPEAHFAIETGYHWELNLPRATPVTFLSAPEVPKL